MSNPITIAAVIIGRNEGARLVNCLNSIASDFSCVVYVDSGSTDDSVAVAHKAGAKVIELDESQPFSAARGRNMGVEFLMSENPPDFIQLLDGDCILEKSWIDEAVKTLIDNDNIGIVTGWRSEIHTDASIYNALCDFEWHRPAGEIQTCGGDMLVRSKVFDRVEFDARVIAAEDDEFCVKVRSSGWKMLRLPINMSRHDADMHRFAQWWQRAVRSGHGFAQVGFMHSGYFQTEQRRVLFYGALLPVIGLMAAIYAPLLLAPVIGLYLLSYIRTASGLLSAGLQRSNAMSQAVFLSLSKFPNLQGMALFHWRRLRHGHINIIEYK